MIFLQSYTFSEKKYHQFVIMDFFDKPTIFRNFAFSESNKCPPQKKIQQRFWLRGGMKSRGVKAHTIQPLKIKILRHPLKKTKEQ